MNYCDQARDEFEQAPIRAEEKMRWVIVSLVAQALSFCILWGRLPLQAGIFGWIVWWVCTLLLLAAALECYSDMAFRADERHIVPATFQAWVASLLGGFFLALVLALALGLLA